DKIATALHIVHHQFKYLVLHGLALLQATKDVMQSELMEPYGHGDLVIMDGWEIIHLQIPP
mgnify:CR=1